MVGLSRGGLWHPSVAAHTWRPLDCSSSSPSSKWLPVINPGMRAGQGESLCSRCWQSLSVALRANLAADMPSPVSCYSSIPDPVLPDYLRLPQSTLPLSLFFFQSLLFGPLLPCLFGLSLFSHHSLALLPLGHCSDCFFSSHFHVGRLGGSLPPPPSPTNAWAAPGPPAFAARLHGGNKQWAYC